MLVWSRVIGGEGLVLLLLLLQQHQQWWRTAAAARIRTPTPPFPPPAWATTWRIFPARKISFNPGKYFRGIPDQCEHLGTSGGGGVAKCLQASVTRPAVDHVRRRERTTPPFLALLVKDTTSWRKCDLFLMTNQSRFLQQIWETFLQKYAVSGDWRYAGGEGGGGGGTALAGSN